MLFDESKSVVAPGPYYILDSLLSQHSLRLMVEQDLISLTPVVVRRKLNMLVIESEDKLVTFPINQFNVLSNGYLFEKKPTPARTVIGNWRKASRLVVWSTTFNLLLCSLLEGVSTKIHYNKDKEAHIIVDEIFFVERNSIEFTGVVVTDRDVSTRHQSIPISSFSAYYRIPTSTGSIRFGF